MRRLSFVFVTLAALGCTLDAPEPAWPTSEGLAACSDQVLARGECHTLRALTGTSMGGGAAAGVVSLIGARAHRRPRMPP